MKTRLPLLTLVLPALSLALTWPRALAGQATANVPVQDVTYRYIERLIGEGLVDTVHIGQKPYTRREVARIVAEAEERLSALGFRLSAGRGREPRSDSREPRSDSREPRSDSRELFVRRILAALKAEYGTDGGAGTRVLESALADWTWTNSPPRVVPSDDLGGISATTNPFVDYRLGRRYVDGGNLALETTHRVRLLSVLAAAARVRTWNGWSELSDSGGHRLSVEALYGQLALGNLLVEVGRDHIFYGQGMRASLSVSGNAPALDMVKVASDRPFRLPWLFRALGPTRASLFVADLGERQNFPGAKLAGYKVSFLPSPRVEFGVSVIDQMGGRGAPSASFGERLLDLIPLVDPIFYGDRDLQFSNKLAGMDLRVRFPNARGIQWYVEGMIDDFDHRRVGSSLWQDAGWITGLTVPRAFSDGRLQLAAELHHTGLRYYQHWQFVSGLTLDGRIIGNALGAKSDAAYGRLSWETNGLASITLDAAYERRSNDQYRILANDADHDNWRFVRVETRPKETRSRIVLSWSGELSPTRPRVIAEVGYERVGNFAFVAGANRDNVLARIALERRF